MAQQWAEEVSAHLVTCGNEQEGGVVGSSQGKNRADKAWTGNPAKRGEADKQRVAGRPKGGGGGGMERTT